MLSTPPAFVLSQDQTLHECFPVIGMNTTRAERPVGIRPVAHSVLAVSIAYPPQWAGRTFKGTSNLPKQAGVSTYLALTFGTLLSSQGTDALAFVFPTLSDPFGPDSQSAGPFDIHYVSRFPGELIIEFRESNSDMRT